MMLIKAWLKPGCARLRKKPWGRPHPELLSQFEREASLADLLTPVAPLVGVTDDHVLISVRAKAGVDVHGDVGLVWANVDRKTAAM